MFWDERWVGGVSVGEKMYVSGVVLVSCPLLPSPAVTKCVYYIYMLQAGFEKQ